MRKDKIIPEHVFDLYEQEFELKKIPNIVRPKNITYKGLETLIEKNNLIWSSSIFDKGYNYLEGVIKWGSNTVFIYFIRLEHDTTYKIYILTDSLKNIDMLLIGLNNHHTIDKL